ncbi:MAG TPA: permease [Candidatus Limnocylindria bacterium]
MTHTHVEVQKVAAVTGGHDGRLRFALAAAAAAWAALFALNERIWGPILGGLIGLDLDSRAGDAVRYFAYDSVKIMLLLVGLIFAIGLLRASFSPERARSLLMGRGLLVGLGLAAVLGAVTPFCACSSVPVFIGLVAAGVPLAVTMTFLISSPIISEVGAVMMGGLFGWHVTALYLVAGTTLAILAGWALGRLNLERWVEPFVFATPVGKLAARGHAPTLAERVAAARQETADIARSVWPYVLVGIGLGAVIHNWVPADFFATYAGEENPFAVVVATLAGAPLYANPAGVVPIAEALTAKGVALGTSMAFVMSVVAISVPSTILLRRVLKPPLLAIFTGIVAVGIMLVGFLLNLIS